MRTRAGFLVGLVAMLVSGYTQPGRAAPPAPDAAGPDTTVTVRGDRVLLERSSRDATAASTVIRHDRLEAAGQTAAGVLEEVPGVAVQRTGSPSDLATASIRGSDSSQVPVYVAGIRVNDDVTGTADLSTIPLWMMDRVEVFRGNAPASADQLGLGGAIFFWPRLPSETRAGAGAHVGSFGEVGEQAAAEVGGPRAGALFAVRRDHASNDYPFVNDGGRRFDRADFDDVRRNADATTYDAWAVGRYRLDRRASVATAANAFDREQGVTGLSVIPADSARSHARRVLAGASGTFPCSAGDGCRLEVSTSVIAARLTISDPDLELPAQRTPLLHTSGERATERVAVVLRPFPVLTVDGSLTQVFEGTRTDRVDNLPKHGTRSTTKAAVSGTWQADDRLALLALVSLECATTRGVDERFNAPVESSDPACGVLAPTGRLGAAFELSRGVSLLGNAGHYVRVPTLSELYGSSPLTQGSSVLEPETGENADLGVRASTDGALGRYSVDVSGFARTVRNLIRFRNTGLSVVAPYNVGRARVLGVEATAAGEWFRHVRAEASATLTDARDTTTDAAANPTTNDVIPLTPRLVSLLRLEAFTASGLRALRQERTSLALTYLHRASRYADPAGQVVLPQQDSLDVEAASTHLGGALRALFAVRNVTDSRQFDLVGLPLPGRSFHGEIQAWW